MYIALLWCWGETLVRFTQVGLDSQIAAITNAEFVAPIGFVAATLLWIVGIAIFFGLPDYYRQAPGTVPDFVSSILRRRIVLWFFMMVVCLLNFSADIKLLLIFRPGCPELLSVHALWPQLAISLVLAASHGLDGRYTCSGVFHHHLEPIALHHECLQ